MVIVFYVFLSTDMDGVGNCDI